MENDNGKYRSTRATAEAENAVQLRCGKCTADGPRVNEPWNVSIIATTAIAMKTRVIWRRRSSSAAAMISAVAPASHQTECRWSVKAFGVADTSFHAN